MFLITAFFWQHFIFSAKSSTLHRKQTYVRIQWNAAYAKQKALIIPNTIQDYEDVWEFIKSKLDKLQIHEEKML